MSDDFYTFDEYSKMKEFDRRLLEHESRKEAMNNHPAGKSAPETTTKNRLSDEASAYLGLTILWFFFVTIPLALLFAGIAVVPATEAIFKTEIGYWTAFFLLMTIRWLILQPRNGLLLRNLSEQKGR